MDQNPQNSRRARHSGKKQQPLEPNFSRGSQSGGPKWPYLLGALAAFLLLMSVPIYGFLTQTDSAASSETTVSSSTNSTSESSASSESETEETASSESQASSAVESSEPASSSEEAASQPTTEEQPPATSEVEQPANDPAATYTVEAGQGWYRISVNTGVPVETLQALNPGVELAPGTVIRTR